MRREGSAGRIVGGVWRLERLLGEGGQGTAWAARHRGDGRLEVLKQLRGRADGPARTRFDREAEILRRLRHPHIVPALEVFEESDGPFIRMAMAAGVDLRRRLFARALEDRPFGPEALDRFVAMACDALGYCHAESVVHRDLKPGNMMLVEAEGAIEHLTLLDFGVARWADTDASQATTAGRVLGSHRYGSPEQLRGEQVGPASDLFALAAVLFEMISLRRAWLRSADGSPARWQAAVDPRPNGRVEVVRRIMNVDWVPLGDLDPALAVFDPFFERAFAPLATDRFQDAAAFRRGFEDALGEAGPALGWTQVSPSPLDAEEGETQLPTVANEAEDETRLAESPPWAEPKPGRAGRWTVARAKARAPAAGRAQGSVANFWLVWAGSPWTTVAFLIATALLLTAFFAGSSPKEEEAAAPPTPRARPR